MRSSQTGPEIVLFMNSRTGEIEIEGISCDGEPTAAKPAAMRAFRTGLIYEANVAAKIRWALAKRGVKVHGVPGKCINISKDWLVQILTILYYGLFDGTPSDRLAYLIHAANNNSEWKNNPGIELQKIKEKEYWDKVERHNRTKQAKTAPGHQCRPKRHGIKALVVDDELVSGSMLAFLISPLGECDLVNNGPEAIKAFVAAIDAGETYDLVTLDIVMPDMDGHEILKRIRNIEEERGIASAKIVMVTAMDNATAILSAFKEQCDGYLVKPIRKEDLMKRLGELNLTGRHTSSHDQ